VAPGYRRQLRRARSGAARDNPWGVDPQAARTCTASNAAAVHGPITGTDAFALQEVKLEVFTDAFLQSK
jgi:hypothetical protein